MDFYFPVNIQFYRSAYSETETFRKYELNKTDNNMKRCKQSIIVLLTITLSMAFRISSSQDYLTNQSQGKSDFKWPEGKENGIKSHF